MPGRFEVYFDEAGKYRWMLRGHDGAVVAGGQGYDSQDAAVAAARAVRHATEGADIYVEVDEGNADTRHAVQVVNTLSKLIRLEE